MFMNTIPVGDLVDVEFHLSLPMEALVIDLNMNELDDFM